MVVGGGSGSGCSYEDQSTVGISGSSCRNGRPVIEEANATSA